MNKLLQFLLIFVLILILVGVYLFVAKEKEKNSLPIIIKEESSQYNISVEVNKTGVSSIDIALKNFIDNKISDLKAIAQDIREEDGYDFMAGLVIKDKTFQFENLKSLMLEIYDYAGGAHGNVYYKTWVFNKKGDVFSLADLFKKDADFLSEIFPLVKEDLAKQLHEPFDQDWLDRGTGDEDESNYKNFVLDEENLIFFFPPYQVASYAEGQKVVKIPLVKLSNILKNNF